MSYKKYAKEIWVHLMVILPSLDILIGLNRHSYIIGVKVSSPNYFQILKT